MLNLQAVLISNGVGATLMVVLLISNRLNARHVFFDEKIFCAMASLTLRCACWRPAPFFLDGRTFPLALPLKPGDPTPCSSSPTCPSPLSGPSMWISSSLRAWNM